MHLDYASCKKAHFSNESREYLDRNETQNYRPAHNNFWHDYGKSLERYAQKCNVRCLFYDQIMDVLLNTLYCVTRSIR